MSDNFPLRCVGLIDDAIIETSINHFGKIRKGRNIKLISSIAAAVLLTASVPVGISYSRSGNMTNYDSNPVDSQVSNPVDSQVSNTVDSQDSNNDNSQYNTTVQPLVIFNDKFYVLSPSDYPFYELPEGYVLVGTVTSNDKADKGSNGYSSGCHVGDKIYQIPDNTNYLMVYTTLFTGSDKYHYLKFVDGDYLYSIRRR